MTPDLAVMCDYAIPAMPVACRARYASRVVTGR
jgi:hypothetical protein